MDEFPFDPEDTSDVSTWKFLHEKICPVCKKNTIWVQILELEVIDEVCMMGCDL